jgi:hypothetical protein
VIIRAAHHGDLAAVVGLLHEDVIREVDGNTTPPEAYAGLGFVPSRVGMKLYLGGQRG